MIARLKSLGVNAAFGIVMFTIGSTYTGFLMAMGKPFIDRMSGGAL